MVRNPNKTRFGESIIDDIPHHVNLVYRREPRIWYSEVMTERDEFLDMEYDNGMRGSYIEDSGSKSGGLRDAMNIAAHHDIPINIFSGGKIVKRIKPRF